jgi:hypothetical protein
MPFSMAEGKRPEVNVNIATFVEISYVYVHIIWPDIL